jgi:hypothetical protein
MSHGRSRIIGAVLIALAAFRLQKSGFVAFGRSDSLLL